MKKSGMHSRMAALCFGLIAGIALTMAQGSAVYAKTVYLETKETDYWHDQIGAYSFLQYDAAGNNISVTTTDPAGNIEGVLLTAYDAGGRKVAENHSYYTDGIPMRTEKSSFQYDAAGHIIAETNVYEEYSKIKSSDHFVYEYDAAGNKTHAYCLQPDGTIDQLFSTNYDYDAKGNVIRQYDYEDDGKTVKDESTVIFKNTYDKAGRLTRETRYSSNGELLSDTSYIYDKAGNCVKEINYNKDGSVSDYSVYEYTAFQK